MAKTTIHKPDFTPEILRARFAKLRALRDELDASMEPMREVLADAAARQAAIREEVRETEAAMRVIREKLVPVDQELALITRALRGPDGISRTHEPTGETA